MNRTSLAEPLVSIVLATNRNSQFLDTTLKSVSDPTWQHWELIIVDNGGPDPSTLDEFSKTVPNCIVGRNAEIWVGNALPSAKSGHALRASGELARAFGWSAPRVATLAATRLGRFIREQGRKRVLQAGA